MADKPRRQIDWFRVGVYFFFGAFIGACAGLRFLPWSVGGGVYDFLPTLGLALLFGTVSAVFGDRLWNRFVR
ncbi:MAG: hypothetical protein ACYS76_12290 [Planctomycetota bacterium]